MFLLTQIQLHDHPSIFGVAEVLFAIAAKFSVCLRHIAAQRLLKLLRDAAPRDHIAHAGIPHIHDAGPLTILIRQNQVPQKHIRKGCALILGFFPPALGSKRCALST